MLPIEFWLLLMHQQISAISKVANGLTADFVQAMCRLRHVQAV